MTTGSVPVRERMAALDVLRGVAVCGILLMNIPLMGMLGDLGRPPLPAAPNLDWAAFTIQDVAFAGSMRGLFTLLFGAGMLIMLRNVDGPDGAEAVQSYLTRCFALMLLGVANFALFLWPGEILFNYGLVGLSLLLFRKARPRLLMTAAAALLVVMTLGLSLPSIDRAAALREGPAAAAAKAEKKELTPGQQAALKMQARAAEAMRPPPEKLEKERAQRTRYPGVLVWSARMWSQFNLSPMALYFSMESLAFMLIGMALFQNGVLGGGRSIGFYAALAAGGYGLGFAVRGIFMAARWSTGFEINPEQMVWGGFLYEAGRLPTTLGLLGLVLMLFKAGALGVAATALKAIGRLALTNYVGQSIITGVIFYVFGWVGKLGFAQLMGVAVLIWVFQAVFSLLWLRRYEMGPLEWGLRMLTYGVRYPLPKAGPAQASGG